MRHGFLAVCLAIFAVGCSVPGIYLERGFGDSGNTTVVPPGIVLIDKSGHDLAVDSLKLWVFIIEQGFKSLKECIGESDFPEQALLKVPIILLPPKKLVVFNEEVNGFTDTSLIFIRSDNFDMNFLRHEWIHIYLWLTGQRFLGDIFHKDPLFKKCVYIKDY